MRDWSSRNWGSHTGDGCEMAISRTGVKAEGEVGALPRSRDLAHPVIVDQSLSCLGLQQSLRVSE